MAIYKIMWETNVQSDRPQKTKLHTRFAVWIAKATDAQLFAFHGNNGYANASQYYLYTATEYFKTIDAQQAKEMFALSQCQ
jgi:hypothetical protein